MNNLVLLLFVTILYCLPANAQVINGLWEGEMKDSKNNTKIPVEIYISVNNTNVITGIITIYKGKKNSYDLIIKGKQYDDGSIRLNEVELDERETYTPLKQFQLIIHSGGRLMYGHFQEIVNNKNTGIIKLKKNVSPKA